MISLTKQNINEEVYTSTKPVVIDVYASWCGPCQYMKPIFEQLHNELGDTHKFVTLNVDESRDLAIEFGITSVPTFIFMKGKEVLGKETGYMSKDDLKLKIQAYLG